MKKKQTIAIRRSDCPVACVLDIIGDKWTLLVVRDLALGKRHFEEFLNSPEKIATNILSDRLRRLEISGFVVKEVDQRDRRKSIYRLTPSGQELKELVRRLAQWGLTHIPKTKLLPEASKMGQSN